MTSSLVRLQGASFQFTDANPILHDVDLVLTPGWTGLVGANGAGKTTLLRLVDGTLRPSAGLVRREPDGARVATCQQEVHDRTDAIVGFAGAWDGPARRLHGRLRLDPDAIDRWPTLSAGERKRWQIGAALAEEPDVLLLDEPTNHLDASARAWLLDALRAFPGVGVVVSHDRAVLDSLTARTVRVDRGRAMSWPVPYSQARVAWELERQQRVDARQSAQDEARRLQRQRDALQREREGAERQRSAGARMRNRNDSDARGILAQTKADWAEAALARRAGITRRRVDDALAQIDPIEVDVELGRSVFAQFERCPQAFLAVREAAPIVRGGRTIVDAPTLAWGRGDRIRLEGPNGAGKTTLVQALLEHARVDVDRLLVLPQDPAPASIASALAWLHALPPAERGRVLSIVAALGVAPDRLLATARPSPGEARKLLIARGLGSQAWGLVLDEPTNHLDLPALERLEAALAAYPGALLLVTHDDAFARACTTSRWRIEGGRIERSGP